MSITIKCMQWPHVFSGVGDAPVENPNNQETDNVSYDESQDEDLIR